jgi:PBP1b-binding outer membrane lipoprotein LpoB
MYPVMKHFTIFIPLSLFLAGCINNTSSATDETVHDADSVQTGSTHAASAKLIYQQKCTPFTDRIERPGLLTPPIFK